MTYLFQSSLYGFWILPLIFDATIYHQGVVTQKLCTPLNLAHRDASLGTLESQIRHMIMKILIARKIPEELEEQEEEEQEYN